MGRLAAIALSLPLLVFGAPAAAQAQTPTPPKPTPPQKKAAALTLAASTGIADRGRTYVARSQRVTLKGSADPDAVVAVSVAGHRGRRVVLHPAVKAGAFKVAFKARRPGRYLVRATQASGRPAKPVSVYAVAPSAGSGSSGWKVRVLKKGLREQGFAVDPGSGFSAATGRAVLAFRKTNSLRRTGFASGKVFGLLLRRRGAFPLRFPKAGRHVEFDWSRQVVVLADKGRPVNTYHASSGKPSTPTVFGTFHFYSKTPGTNAKGMVDANYFIGGYAIHGYHEVPNYAASHGCIRVPIPSAASIAAQINLGETIYVYR